MDGDSVVPGVQPVTVATNGSGQFLSGNLRPGIYGVRQTQPTGFISVSDSDGGPLDEIRPITVTAGTTSGGPTFVEEQPASISGIVLADINNNDTGDSPVAGVILTLKGAAGQDMDSDPVAPGIQPTTTTTGSDGRYNLTNLPPGSYRVVQTQPDGFFSVTDSDGGNPDVIGDITPIELKTGGSAVNKNFIEEEPGSLGGTVLADTDSNGSGNTALPLVLLTLKDGAGADLDSNPVLGGVQPTVAVTASNGSYLSAGLSPGFYQIWQTQPAGYLSIDDADRGNPDRIGGPVPIMVSAGNVKGGRNFLEKPEPPDRFDEWKNADGLTGLDAQPLPGASGQGGNPDTDLYSNLLEYAFGFPPGSGVHPKPAGEVRLAGGGRIDCVLTYNNAPVDLVISLEVAGCLDTPVVWAPAGTLATTVTDNFDGTSTMLFEDLESLGAAFADGNGFVRVRVGLDSDGDTIPDLFDYAPVTGWTDHTHPGRIPLVMDNKATTFAMPYLGPPLNSGAVTGNTANGLDLTDAAGGISLVAPFSPAKRYFVEITGGSPEGRRFEMDVAASTAAVAALKSVSRVHTRSLTAGALTGAPVVIRELAAFDRLFPPGVFLAGTSSSNADSLLVYRGNSWITYFLADLGALQRWVRPGDASLADQGGEIVAPGDGLFVRRRGASLTIARHGFVRTNVFALPLTGGGSVLVGSAYPLDQSYATRGMTVAAGFQGGVDLALASRVLFWTGDAVPGALGYATDFLLDGGSPALRYWAGGSDSFLTDKNALPLFKATGAAFLSLPVALPGYVMPAPWSSAPQARCPRRGRRLEFRKLSILPPPAGRMNRRESASTPSFPKTPATIPVMSYPAIGSPAPSFRLPVVGEGYPEGTLLSSADLAGKVYVLYFYPKDDTPGCTTQACALRDDWSELSEKAAVFGVSIDPPQSHRKFIQKHRLPFPLLSDEAKTLAEAYGVWVEKSMYGKTYLGTERSTFVIGPDGNLNAILPKVKPAEHLGQLLSILTC